MIFRSMSMLLSCYFTIFSIGLSRPRYLGKAMNSMLLLGWADIVHDANSVQPIFCFAKVLQYCSRTNLLDIVERSSSHYAHPLHPRPLSHLSKYPSFSPPPLPPPFPEILNSASQTPTLPSLSQLSDLEPSTRDRSSPFLFAAFFHVTAIVFLGILSSVLGSILGSHSNWLLCSSAGIFAKM